MYNFEDRNEYDSDDSMNEIPETDEPEVPDEDNEPGMYEGEEPEADAFAAAEADEEIPAEEPQVGEFAARSAPEEPRTYAYEDPASRPSPYSDAGYVPTADASAVPKSFHCAGVNEKKPRKEKRPGKRPGAAGFIAACLVCAILGGLVGGVAPRLFDRQTGAAQPEETVIEDRAGTAATASTSGSGKTVINVASGTTKTVTTNKVDAGAELTATEIYYNLAVNQVVGIKSTITYTNVFGYTTSGAVSGSGFIISADGYILTNNHVIEDAVEGKYDIKVLTYDGTEYTATVVGREEDNDVAVLKIDAEGLIPATLGDSDEMLVGETVYAVGNPLGELEYTMTDGMVSALDREISSTDSATGVVNTINMFQISAAINSGNSGGPVYNSRGEVIGISTAKYSDTGVEGLGFAIPINDAVHIANDLISVGYVRGKAYMGVSVGTVTASAAQYYGLVQGAIVAGVTEGGCAEKAGLKESDIIVALDGREISSRDDLINAKKNYSAGDTAVLKVYRGTDYIELTITFDEETPEVLAAEAKAAEEEAKAQQQEQQRSSRSGGSYGGYGSYYDFFNDFFGSTPFGR